MKKTLSISYLFLFFFMLTTFAQKTDKESQETLLPFSMKQVEVNKAKTIIDQTCVTCHSPTASMHNRLAPPLEAVKRRYLMQYPNAEDFVRELSSFVKKPSEEKALLRGAVQRFELMPNQNLSAEQAKAVAEYIYHFELDKPEWFDAHFQEMHPTKIDTTKPHQMRRNGH